MTFVPPSKEYYQISQGKRGKAKAPTFTPPTKEELMKKFEGMKPPSTLAEAMQGLQGLAKGMPKGMPGLDSILKKKEQRNLEILEQMKLQVIGPEQRNLQILEQMKLQA
jgi:hypothetical protein